MEIFTTAIGLILSGNTDLITIITLSLRVSLSATLIAALFAIPTGAALAILQFPGRRLLLVISSAFMALPPVMVGLFVYLLLSRSGPLGEFGLLFTPTAMIIAQTILIFPIILSLTQQAVQPLNREYISLFNALDTPRSLRIQTIIWDARFAVSIAILAGFGRALAEVGAVIIVGGNINGLTRVMTTTIALETSKGNLQLALALGLVLLMIAFSVSLLTHTIARMGEKYQMVRA
jgi:tungstate transport system permease protein